MNLDKVQEFIESPRNNKQFDLLQVRYFGNYYLLHMAPFYGHFDIICYLIDIKKIDIHTNNDYLLRWSLFHNHTEIIAYLIEKGADYDKSMQWLISVGQSVKDYMKHIIITTDATKIYKPNKEFINALIEKDYLKAEYIYLTNKEKYHLHYFISKIMLNDQFENIYRFLLKNEIKYMLYINKQFDKLAYACNN